MVAEGGGWSRRKRKGRRWSRSKVRKRLSLLCPLSLSLSVSRISWRNLIPSEGREENRATTYPYTLIIRVDPPRLGSHLPRFALAFAPSSPPPSTLPFFISRYDSLSRSRATYPLPPFPSFTSHRATLTSSAPLNEGEEEREREREGGMVNVEQTEQVDSGDDTLRANESSWNSSSRPWQSNLRFKLVASVFLVRITEGRRDLLPFGSCFLRIANLWIFFLNVDWY